MLKEGRDYTDGATPVQNNKSASNRGHMRAQLIIHRGAAFTYTTARHANRSFTYDTRAHCTRDATQ
jgi:hypothetical protein